ncbi:hypothetical protein Fmac_031287 [Flemingia macrophylla]|uniref:Uncharacterized protein n=1 Tax=Flemingia macrophylla TaxID=520843 RepID=A0ABD1L1N3_9FABA
MMLTSLVVLVIFILFVLRPIMFWMIQKTPKGEPSKEAYILFHLYYVGVFIMIGEHLLVGPVLLGLEVLEGPPLGSAFVETRKASVGIVFIEGSHDREPLSYAMRMAGYPNVTVSVIRLIEPGRKSRNSMDTDPGDLINKSKSNTMITRRNL